jgi:PIN domain nuclease of toxin-antitoxin system
VSEIVLDASALMAVLREEPGAAAVEAVLDAAAISTVNLSEVQAKLVERGTPAELAWSSLIDLDLAVIAFDAARRGSLAIFVGRPKPAGCRLATGPASRWLERSGCRR